MGEDSMERERRFPVRKIKVETEDTDFWSSPTPSKQPASPPKENKLPLLNW